MPGTRPGMTPGKGKAMDIKVGKKAIGEATEKLKNGAVLDALVKVHERLQEMRDDRLPIIEYATEEELRQDAGA